VARAKGEIALGLPSDGTFIVPSDSPWTGLWQELADDRLLLTCGPDTSAGVRVETESVQGVWDEGGFHTGFTVVADGSALELEMRLAGMHNVRNALVAVAVASVLKIDPEAIRAGLAGLKPVAGRLNPRRGSGRVRVIDDSYNANPDSVRAAIDVLVGLPGRRSLVLGDLGELGPEAEKVHLGLGKAARAAGLDALYTVGELSALAADAFGPGSRHFSDQTSLISDLHARLGPDDLVLVKGSRLAAMERVADALCEGGED
jgi:UDP-N-acetylmuramoyl-tripeptide--D-alanyl-D-alanine ligase